MNAAYTFTDAGRHGASHTQRLCAQHADESIARRGLRRPLPHEHSATTRFGHGRGAYTVTVRALTSGAALACDYCTAPTSEELSAFNRGEL
jgi:hypothetical protein